MKVCYFLQWKLLKVCYTFEWALSIFRLRKNLMQFSLVIKIINLEIVYNGLLNHSSSSIFMYLVNFFFVISLSYLSSCSSWSKEAPPLIPDRWQFEGISMLYLLSRLSLRLNHEIFYGLLIICILSSSSNLSNSSFYTIFLYYLVPFLLYFFLISDKL